MYGRSIQPMLILLVGWNIYVYRLLGDNEFVGWHGRSFYQQHTQITCLLTISPLASSFPFLNSITYL